LTTNVSYWNFDRRAIATGRAVRVNAQLKSHQRFARAFPKYCELVDNARLYFTNAIDHPPKVNFNNFILTILVIM